MTLLFANCTLLWKTLKLATLPFFNIKCIIIERERAPLWFVWSSVTVVGSCPSIVSTVPPPPPSTTLLHQIHHPSPAPPQHLLLHIRQSLTQTQPETGHHHLVRVQKLHSQQEASIKVNLSSVSLCVICGKDNSQTRTFDLIVILQLQIFVQI